MLQPFRAAVICVAAALFIAGFFALAGRLDWGWGWICMALLTAGNGVSDLALWVANPGLLVRRGRMGEGTRTWDRVCLAVFAAGVVATLVVGALDAGRLPAPWTMPWMQWTGVALFVAGQALVTWSMLVNPFFEKTARLQRECGHRVIDTGPYGVVRHPGYAGAIAAYAVAPPLILGSWWAFIPAAVTALCLVARTILEDRMLRAELEGYADYCNRVPTRLWPFIWARSHFPTPAR